MEEQINSAIKQALEEAPERKFVESIEMAFTIKDVDLKNPANRIEENVRLPRGRGKDISIAIFAGGEMATKAKKAGIVVIDPTQIEDLGGNRQKARKLARKHDFFLSEVP
ncbi:MAG TPA: 50S ribosomal protein L1, partial [Candidatus Thalassarchaeaceae archaeon]